MDNAETKQVVRLAREGKPISQIVEEDFPHLDYGDVYWAVRGGGERSAWGTKKMITNRLNLLDGAKRAQRDELVAEIAELVWHLYNNHKANSKKLAAIRKALDR